MKLILPAFGLYAAFAMSSRAALDRDVQLRVLGGVVHVGQNVLRVEDEPAQLSRSLAGSTGEGSRARIIGSDAVLVVEPSTSFAVEKLSPLRLRLFEGELLFDGRIVVATDAGILESTAGSGVVQTTPAGIEIVISRGDVEFHDARGPTSARPGEPLHVPHPRTDRAN